LEAWYRTILGVRTLREAYVAVEKLVPVDEPITPEQVVESMEDRLLLMTVNIRLASRSPTYWFSNFGIVRTFRSLFHHMPVIRGQDRVLETQSDPHKWYAPFVQNALPLVVGFASGFWDVPLWIRAAVTLGTGALNAMCKLTLPRILKKEGTETVKRRISGVLLRELEKKLSVATTFDKVLTNRLHNIALCYAEVSDLDVPADILNNTVNYHYERLYVDNLENRLLNDVQSVAPVRPPQY